MAPANGLRALVLAGGLGLRLRSVVGELPKSLAPVGGRPFLHYLLVQLHQNGIHDVTICTGYGADAVQSFVGKGEAWGLRVSYSNESSPLGTGGAVRLALERGTDDRVIVLNGDSFFDIALDDLIASHSRMGGLATVAARHTDAAGRYGTLRIGMDGDVVAFGEKTVEGPAEMNAGIYILERAAMDRSPVRTAFSLERDLFPTLIGSATGDRWVDGQLKAAVFEGFFVDIGIPRDHASIDRDPGPLSGRSVRC